MAKIRTTCTDCGDVEVVSRQVNLRVCKDNSSACYDFRCPKCAGIIVKTADLRTAELLVDHGVRLQTWSLPLELLDAVRYSGAAPICEDDLLDFHELLKTDAWFEDLTS